MLDLASLLASVHSLNGYICMSHSLINICFPFLPGLFSAFLTFGGWGMFCPCYILIGDDYQLLICNLYIFFTCINKVIPFDFHPL
jgi:uncharacterized membrane protein